jgi:hypothetical protein
MDSKQACRPPKSPAWQGSCLGCDLVTQAKSSSPLLVRAALRFLSHPGKLRPSSGEELAQLGQDACPGGGLAGCPSRGRGPLNRSSVPPPTTSGLGERRLLPARFPANVGPNNGPLCPRGRVVKVRSPGPKPWPRPPPGQGAGPGGPWEPGNPADWEPMRPPEPLTVKETSTEKAPWALKTHST